MTLEHVLRKGVYLIRLNTREFRELVGSDIEDESQIKSEARNMVKSGWLRVISLGVAGALMVSENVAGRTDRQQGRGPSRFLYHGRPCGPVFRGPRCS